MIALYRDHHDMLFGYMLALCGNHHLAEDLVQETFVVVWRKLREETAPVSNPGAWLRTIGKNVMMNEFQRLKRRPLCLVEEVADVVAERLTCSGHSGPWNEALDQCMKGIGEKGKKILDLRYSQGLSCDRIAGEMQMTLDAVHQWLSRLRVRLKECVEGRLQKEQA